MLMGSGVEKVAGTLLGCFRWTNGAMGGVGGGGEGVQYLCPNESEKGTNKVCVQLKKKGG